MSTATDNLGRKEALLLLYLAGELRADERTQVDHMLASDPGMREMLEQLRGCHELIQNGLSRLDAIQPLPAPDSITRGIVRTMRQWQTEQLTRATRPVEQPTPRVNWRTYVSAAAAVALVAYGVIRWADTADRAGDNSPPMATLPVDEDEELPSVRPESPAYEPILALDRTFGNDDALADVENSINQLQALSIETR